MMSHDAEFAPDPNPYPYTTAMRNVADVLCGARAQGGSCGLPAGHNMGRADVPANHAANPALEVDEAQLVDHRYRDAVIDRFREQALAIKRVRDLCVAVEISPDSDGKVWAAAVLEALDGVG